MFNAVFHTELQAELLLVGGLPFSVSAETDLAGVGDQHAAVSRFLVSEYNSTVRHSL